MGRITAKNDRNTNASMKTWQPRKWKTNRYDDGLLKERWRKNKDEAKQTLTKQPVFGHLEATLLLGWCSLDRSVCKHTHKPPRLEFRLPRSKMKWSVDSLACHRKQWAAVPHVAGRTGQGGAGGGRKQRGSGSKEAAYNLISSRHICSAVNPRAVGFVSSSIFDEFVLFCVC